MILKIVFTVIFIGYFGLFAYFYKTIKRAKAARSKFDEKTKQEIDKKIIGIYQGIASLGNLLNWGILIFWVIWMFGLIEINWVGF